MWKDSTCFSTYKAYEKVLFFSRVSSHHILGVVVSNVVIGSKDVAVFPPVVGTSVVVVASMV